MDEDQEPTAQDPTPQPDQGENGDAAASSGEPEPALDVVKAMPIAEVRDDVLICEWHVHQRDGQARERRRRR